MSDNYAAATARTAYYPSGSTSLARLWSREKLVQDLADLGVVAYFEGAGTNPTGLAGYDRAKLWLNAAAGVTPSVGTVRKYAGGDPTLVANWPALTRAGFVAHIRVGEMHFAWSPSTSGDPGTGKVLADNATLASATALHVSKTDVNGQTVAARIATWDDGARGDVFLTAIGESNRYGLFRVTGAVTDQSTYYVVPVSVQFVGSAPLVAGDFVTTDFAAAPAATAAGSNSQLQMNGSGLLAATTGLEYDSGNNRIRITRGAGIWQQIPAANNGENIVFNWGYSNGFWTNGPPSMPNYYDVVLFLDGANISTPAVLVDPTKPGWWRSREYRFYAAGSTGVSIFAHEDHFSQLAPGTGATVTLTVVAGAITGATITAAGLNYLVGTRFTIGGSGTDGVLEISTINGTGGVTGLTVFRPGSGYTNGAAAALSNIEYRYYSAFVPHTGTGPGGILSQRFNQYNFFDGTGRQSIVFDFTAAGDPIVYANFGTKWQYGKNNTPVASQLNAAGNAQINLPYIDSNNSLVATGSFVLNATGSDPTYQAASALSVAALPANHSMMAGQLSTKTTGNLYALQFYNIAATQKVFAAIGNGTTVDATGHAIFEARTEVGGGDAMLSVLINGGSAYSLGVDQSDSGRWKLSSGPQRLGTAGEDRIVVDGTSKNIGFNGASFGGAAGALYIANVVAAPSSAPSGGGLLYVEAGALKYRGSSGTVTTLAAA